MKIIGITGGFGTGKSTAAAFFRARGAAVLDADVIAHQALKPRSPVHKKILKVFGKEVLGKGGAIDRKALGRIVFGDKRLLARLSAIIHPYVISEIRREIKRIRKHGKNPVIVLDVPLLVEAGLLGMVDKLAVVTADRRTQVKRCMKKMGLTRKEVLARIKAQMPMAKKISLSDFIIDNNGTKNQTKREVNRIWRQIQKQKM